jgi:hypothetical protein
MALTDENWSETIYQLTHHAMLVPWGRFSRHLKLSQRLRTALKVQRHKDAIPGGDLVLEFGMASLAGYEYLQDINKGRQPLAKDQAIEDAWDVRFAHYTNVSRFLYELDEEDVSQVQAELEAVMQPYIRQEIQNALCHQEYLTWCGDLTGRPVSAYSTTYPPDATFGYMANQLEKGHQAVLVSMKGMRHRIHLAAFLHPGSTVSGACLTEIVESAESRTGCRPRRRTEKMEQRILAIEAKMAQKKRWIESQQTIIREQIERQIRLGDQLQALKSQLAELEQRSTAKPVRPHSKLAKARNQEASWKRQLASALELEHQARWALRTHQERLQTLTTERDHLLNRLARLKVDNATNPNPVRIRWLLDGGFGDSANVTDLIESGYDLYTIGHNGKLTDALLKEVPDDASWTQAGSRTDALDMGQRTFGECPYPVRLTLLRWKVGDSFRYSTLISFSDAETLPIEDLFPTYHQRQDVEAGIKQAKGTFSFTKLRVRSPAGIRILSQFALVFWPNFVRWAADWLANQVCNEEDRFRPVLQQVRTQVRIAANTSAVILTNASGQLLEFDDAGPFPGVQLRLDGPFIYQFPMPLFQSWEHLWPISSKSVKEQIATCAVASDSPTLVSQFFARLGAGWPEKVPKNQVSERLPL